MAQNGMVDFMRKMLAEYKTLRGRKKDSGKRPYWDVVVITTADEDQRKAFQLQIEDKASRNELPLDLPIFVVTDPPGTRIGNGGSTLTALEYLHDKYGEKMYQLKTLLIHAGGWSQRMPSASVLGKVFSAVPHGEPLYQMLDLKLAMYWPLVDKMNAGVLLVCADDFLVYDLGPDNSWTIPEKGFTAFAHPSPIELGRTHGVYVLDNPEKLDRQKHIHVVKCLEVLQKPDDERMKKQGAVLNGGGTMTFADGLTVEGKVVYSDSSFYFGSDIMKSLMELKQKIGVITCEIDAYGDFLQGLGPRATSDYVNLTGNISLMTPDLLDTRLMIFNHLRASDLHLLVMNASKFIHIGTTKEYIYHLCEDQVFQEELSLSKDVFNIWTNCDHLNKKRKLETVSKGCVMHSSLPLLSSTSQKSVIEYCLFEVPVHVHSNTIVSNCHVEYAEDMPEEIKIPKGTFLHTVPVLINDSTQFVTVFFGTLDNVKKSCSVSEVASLPFLGKTVGEFCSRSNLKLKDIIPVDKVGEPALKLSLWNLKLFAVQNTMTKSFQFAFQEMTNLMLGEEHATTDSAEPERLSMADMLKVKDVGAMLKYRRNLFDKIMVVKQ